MVNWHILTGAPTHLTNTSSEMSLTKRDGPDMTVVFEVQASHVGIGKSTFVQQLNLPNVDDCIQLVETFGGDWYKQGALSWLSDEDALRAYLVLENYASKLDAMPSTTQAVIASRSPLVSAVQFMPQPLFKSQRDSLVQYYERRLKHAGIDKVYILDYGSSIADNPSSVRLGYTRMLQRSRPFELEKYDSFEKYWQFFDVCEKRKEDIMRDLQGNPFFHYQHVEFNTFDEKDVRVARDIIAAARSAMERPDQPR